MGNTFTNPLRLIEKKVFGVEDRNKSIFVGNNGNSYEVCGNKNYQSKDGSTNANFAYQIGSNPNLSLSVKKKF